MTLPLITNAPRGEEGGSKPPIHFHCLLHAKRGEGVRIACKNVYVNGRPHDASSGVHAARINSICK